MKMNKFVADKNEERSKVRYNNLTKLALLELDSGIGKFDEEIIELVRMFETEIDTIYFYSKSEYKMLRGAMYKPSEEHKFEEAEGFACIDSGKYSLVISSLGIEEDLEVMRDYQKRLENLERFRSYFFRKGEMIGDEWDDVFIDLPPDDDFNPRLDGSLLRVMNLLQDPNAKLYGATHEELFVVTTKEDGKTIQTIYKRGYDYVHDFMCELCGRYAIPFTLAETISEKLPHGIYYKLTKPVYRDVYEYIFAIAEKMELTEDVKLKDYMQGEVATFYDVISRTYFPDFDVDEPSVVVINKVLYIYMPQN